MAPRGAYQARRTPPSRPAYGLRWCIAAQRSAGDGQGHVGAQSRALTGRALDLQRTAYGVQSVGQTGQPGSEPHVRATDPVVTHVETNLAATGLQIEDDVGRAGVLDGIGQCLRGDVVQAHLD